MPVQVPPICAAGMHCPGGNTIGGRQVVCITPLHCGGMGGGGGWGGGGSLHANIKLAHVTAATTPSERNRHPFESMAFRLSPTSVVGSRGRKLPAAAIFRILCPRRGFSRHE